MINATTKAYSPLQNNRGNVYIKLKLHCGDQKTNMKYCRRRGAIDLLVNR